MKRTIQLNNELIDIDVIEQTPKFVLFNLDGKEYAVHLEKAGEHKLHLSMNALNKTVVGVDSHFVTDGVEFVINAPKRLRSQSKAGSLNQMTSPMPGKILKVFVKVGDSVEAGAPIMVMEAMKMEHTIKANKAGKIEKIFYKEGDQISGGVELVELC